MIESNTSIGIRVANEEIFYTIIEKNEKANEIISISSIKIPKALETPESLSYIRNTIITMIQLYNINLAAIRPIEPVAKQSSKNNLRINMEGVIQELFANSSIERYILGTSANVSSIFKIQKKSVEDILGDIIEDNEELRTANDRKLKKEHKESVVVAAAVLEKFGG